MCFGSLSCLCSFAGGPAVEQECVAPRGSYGVNSVTCSSRSCVGGSCLVCLTGRIGTHLETMTVSVLRSIQLPLIKHQYGESAYLSSSSCAGCGGGVGGSGLVGFTGRIGTHLEAATQQTQQMSIHLLPISNIISTVIKCIQTCCIGTSTGQHY